MMRRYIILFLLALAVRLIVAGELRSLDLMPEGFDTRTYYYQALDPSWPPDQPYYFHPLMPLVIRFSFLLFGVSPISPQLLNCLLGAALAPLVALIATHLYGRPVGFLSGLLVAVYQSGVLHSVLLFDTSLTSLILALVVLLALRGRPRDGVSAGLLLALGTLGRSTLPVSALGFAPWRRGRFAVLMLTVLCLCLIPLLARNLYYGHFAPVSINGPINLWIGNHHGAMGTFDVGPCCQSNEAYLSILYGDGRWVYHTLDDIRAYPLDWLKLTLKKLVAFVFLPDLFLGNDILLAEALAHSTLLRFLPGYWLYIVPALAGLIVLRRRWREFTPLFIWYAPYAIVTILFFLMVRYRVPVVPPLAILTAVTLNDIRCRSGLTWPCLDNCR